MSICIGCLSLYFLYIHRSTSSLTPLSLLSTPNKVAIAKGKDHKPYEYGTKASIVTTKTSGIIIGVAAHKKNEHDSKILDAALASANSNRTKPITEAICDRGYRGKKEVDGTNICIPDKPLKKEIPNIKGNKRERSSKEEQPSNLSLVISNQITDSQETILKDLSVMRSIFCWLQLHLISRSGWMASSCFFYCLKLFCLCMLYRSKW